MNYYYDVVLNFQEDYYMFYEWEDNDTLEYIKKIPLFHISEKSFKEIYSSIIKVDSSFLMSIKNKTKLKHNKYLLYTCIISDGKESIALEFNNDGILINRSSLLLEDEINIGEFMYTIDLSKIEYKVIEKIMFKKETRQEEKIKKILKMEIDNMYKNKNISKMKYIYLEWFNELSDNINIMYEKMMDKINDKLTNKEYEIYNLLKITYNV